MTNETNQKEPLSKSKLLEDIANSFQVLQGIAWVLAGLTTVSQLQPAPSIQPTTSTQSTPPETVIYIHPQSGSHTTINFQQINNKINQLSVSEDNETLSKAKEAIAELQQLISDKKTELEQGNVQHVSQGEIEIYLQTVKNEIIKLDNIKQRIEASQEAIDWLDPDTQQKTLSDLAKDAGDYALLAYPELKNPGAVASSSENIQQFYFDIENFLFLIHRCLIVCRPNLLDRALNEKKLPLAPLPATTYIKAFEYIKNNRIPVDIPARAVAELTAYLNYLINALSLLDLSKN